jgi:hypothetical protein
MVTWFSNTEGIVHYRLVSPQQAACQAICAYHVEYIYQCLWQERPNLWRDNWFLCVFTHRPFSKTIFVCWNTCIPHIALCPRKLIFPWWDSFWICCRYSESTITGVLEGLPYKMVAWHRHWDVCVKLFEGDHTPNSYRMTFFSHFLTLLLHIHFGTMFIMAMFSV